MPRALYSKIPGSTVRGIECSSKGLDWLLVNNIHSNVLICHIYAIHDQIPTSINERNEVT